VAKWCILHLPKKQSEEAYRKWPAWEIEWSHDLKGQGHDPNMLRAQYFENIWR